MLAHFGEAQRILKLATMGKMTPNRAILAAFYILCGVSIASVRVIWFRREQGGGAPISIFHPEETYQSHQSFPNP